MGVVLVVGPARAQSSDVTPEYLMRQGVGERLLKETPTLLGDQIDPATGTLSFSQTDVSLPGNSHLEVAFHRTWMPGARSQQKTNNPLGEWYVDVPRITTVVASPQPNLGRPRYNWTWATDRCTNPTLPPTAVTDWVPYQAWQYWNGVSLIVPGRSEGQILKSIAVARSGATLGTQDHWVFSCVSGGASDGGDAYIGYAPNGDQYRFDQMVYTAGPFVGDLVRRVAMLLVTQVTDVNGNWVHYQYTASGLNITSNDGRTITLSYNADRTQATMTANGRTWTYTMSGGTLTQVALPDGRHWTFNLSSLNTLLGTEPDAGTCQSTTSGSGSITHPNGITGTFTLRSTRQSRTYVPTYPVSDPPTDSCLDQQYVIQRAFNTWSVVSKALSGPGYPAASWSYSYTGDPGSTDLGAYGDSGGLPDTKWTKIVDPLGHMKKLYYNRRWSLLEGALMAEEDYQSATSSTPMRTTTYTYTTEGQLGISLTDPKDNPEKMEHPRNTATVAIGQNSDTFTTRYTYDTDFNSAAYSFGRPTLTETWSSVSPTERVTDITYQNDRTLWVLGLPLTVTKNGVLFDRFDYDSLDRRSHYYKFGSLVADATYTYHADGDDGGVAEAGTLASVADVRGQTTRFNNFKRGLPQQIIRKDNNSIYRSVDDNGWVTSETNARGYTTGYSYNSVGWLTSITRPDNFAPTLITYSGLGNGVTQVATRSYTKSNGQVNGIRVTTIYDGLTRPSSVETEDLMGHESAIYTTTSYDALSQVTFQSWPSNASSPTAGINNSYDALGRALCATETVSPNAATCNAYLAGNIVQTTDQVGAVTSTTRSAYGAPDNGDVLQMVDPLGATTVLTRDIFGKVTQLTRSGTQNGYTASVTRQFYYNDRQLLCRRHAPEQGDELFAYDNLDRQYMRAEGQTAGTDCPEPPSGSAITTGYDVLDRPVSTTYPGATASISREFDPNGNITSVSRGGSVWTHPPYNALDLLTGESLAIDGRNYTFSYGYDPIGSLSTTTDPSGTSFSFDPDGFGHSIQVASGSTSYLSSIGYAPNGLVASATFGNGQILTETLNERQLPYRVWAVKSGTATAMDLTYSYSARRQVSSIVDGVPGGSNRSFTYDGAGRLLTASGSWGSGSYSYDALDNLRQTVLGSRTIAATYDPTTNRVATVTDSNGGGTRSYSFDGNGNTVTDGLRIIGHDAADQPVSVSQGGYSSTFAYDGNLKRVKQTTQGGAVTYTVYSKASALVYRDEVNAARHTTYLGAGPAQLRLVNGTPTYSHSDTQGSVVAATDAAGAVLWRERYTPFGDTLVNHAGNRDNTGYTGYLRDTDFNLNYAQARYYDPVTGRFLEPDPLREADQINLYAYVGNDPTDKTDPTGEQEALAACFGGPLACGAGVIVTVAKVVGVAVVAGAVMNNASDSGANNQGGTGAVSPGKDPIGAAIEGGTVIVTGEHPGAPSTSGGNTNPFPETGGGPVTGPVIVVDSAGNAIPVNPGEHVTGSPDGKHQQVRGADGKPTGVRKDGTGHPKQSDPKAQAPHGHVPKVTDSDGNPHLPIH